MLGCIFFDIIELLVQLELKNCKKCATLVIWAISQMVFICEMQNYHVVILMKTSCMIYL